MRIHGSCAARDGQGVLLLGAPGSGKSDLLLRLLPNGFTLVADDQVDLDGHLAAAPASIAGLLEVRGLGVIRLPHLSPVPLALAVTLGPAERMPAPARHSSGVPLVTVDPACASAPLRVALALDCAQGRIQQIAGAFVPC